MNETNKLYQDYKTAQSERRIKRLPRRTELVLSLMNNNYQVEEKTKYQFRITKNGSECVVDVYPIHFRYHIIKGAHKKFNNKRGQIRGEKRFINFIESIFNN